MVLKYDGVRLLLLWLNFLFLSFIEKNKGGEVRTQGQTFVFVQRSQATAAASQNA